MMAIEDFELKGCPFCGGTELGFDYTVIRGHGDRSFTGLRVVCLNGGCEATKGLSNWGEPSVGACISAVAAWNRRNI